MTVLVGVSRTATSKEVVDASRRGRLHRFVYVESLNWADFLVVALEHILFFLLLFTTHQHRHIGAVHYRQSCGENGRGHTCSILDELLLNR